MEAVRACLGQEKGHVNADPDKLSRMRKDSSREEVQKPRGENKLCVVREPKSKVLAV